MIRDGARCAENRSYPGHSTRKRIFGENLLFINEARPQMKWVELQVVLMLCASKEKGSFTQTALKEICAVDAISHPSKKRFASCAKRITLCIKSPYSYHIPLTPWKSTARNNSIIETTPMPQLPYEQHQADKSWSCSKTRPPLSITQYLES
jgi:hypothetical protein